MLMAVAEHVKSHTAGAEPTGKTRPDCLPAPSKSDVAMTLRPFAFCMILAWGMVSIIPNPLNISFAHADIIADKNAPKNQQATILKAGTPTLVNGRLK